MRISVQTESHKLNSKLAINGQKPGPAPYVATLRAVTLEQSEAGIWLVRINHGMPMPATDVEVSLWLRVQALEHYVQVLEHNSMPGHKEQINA